MSIAATATTAAAEECVADEAVMVSGPHLPEAIGEATAGKAEMIPVPAAEQHATALTDPGINAAFLTSSLDTAATPVVAEVPGAEVALPVQSRAASSVPVITTAASATLVASKQHADEKGYASASIKSAAAAVTSVAVVAASGSECDQNTAGGMPKISDKASSDTLWSDAVSATATAMHAESSFRSQAGGVDAPAVEPLVMQQGQSSMQQPTAAEQAEALANTGSSLQQKTPSSGLISSTPAQQSPQPADETGVVRSISGEQCLSDSKDAKQSRLLVPSDSNAPLLPSVKQSVLRLEQMHAAMRSKA